MNDLFVLLFAVHGLGEYRQKNAAYIIISGILVSLLVLWSPCYTVSIPCLFPKILSVLWFLLKMRPHIQQRSLLEQLPNGEIIFFPIGRNFFSDKVFHAWFGEPILIMNQWSSRNTGYYRLLPLLLVAF